MPIFHLSTSSVKSFLLFHPLVRTYLSALSAVTKVYRLEVEDEKGNMSKSTFNAAVIGYGMSAKIFHIPLIQALPEFTLYGIVQRTPQPNNNAANDHAGIKTWTSHEYMLQDPAVDLVIVTSTPDAHYAQTRAALEAGKHVVVEKPFVPTSSEANELVALAANTGKLLTVYQNRRWDQDFLTLKQVLTERKLGNVAEFETHYDRFRPSLPPKEDRTWKNEALLAGGALYDLGSHLLDQVFHLFGPPRTVTGFVGVQKRGVADDECVPDACTVLLEYGSSGERLLVTVKSSSISPEDEQLRFWVRGDKGSFKKVGQSLVCHPIPMSDILCTVLSRCSGRSAQSRWQAERPGLWQRARESSRSVISPPKTRHDTNQLIPVMSQVCYHSTTTAASKESDTPP